MNKTELVIPIKSNISTQDFIVPINYENKEEQKTVEQYFYEVGVQQATTNNNSQPAVP